MEEKENDTTVKSFEHQGVCNRTQYDSARTFDKADMEMRQQESATDTLPRGGQQSRTEWTGLGENIDN